MTAKKHIEFALIVFMALTALSIFHESYSQTATENSRLIISFQSHASGIDGRAKKDIDTFISDYEKEKNVRLAREVVGWGREGELDYCFMLSEITKEDQADFVSRIGIKVKSSDRTSLQENAPCRKARVK